MANIFKANEYQERAEKAEAELASLRASLTADQQQALSLADLIKQRQGTLAQWDAAIAQRQQIVADLDKQSEGKRAQIISFDDEILVQEFGLYQPRYDFMKSDEYKVKLTEIRAKQKELIKLVAGQAKRSNWTVNNNLAQGRKLVGDTTKILYRAFNGDCDEIIRKVKFSNIDASIKAIHRSAETASKLGQVMGVYIDGAYVRVKEEEAYLQFEYQQIKEKEKEELREAREREREEVKLAKEIEDARKKLSKEQQQYSKALADVAKQLVNAGENERIALLEKKEELEGKLLDVEKAVADVDYREANQRAGYVYVISNIGSFGEGVYKIGMTRRLEPSDRIDELSGASVPFNFDIHALIFSDDAPGLETKLHQAFENRKLNLINQRREFFKVSLEDIKQVVKSNFDRAVEFTDIPDAEQYRESEKMRELKKQ